MGSKDGATLGSRDGTGVVTTKGCELGSSDDEDGADDGTILGEILGLELARRDGASEGLALGNVVGVTEGVVEGLGCGEEADDSPFLESPAFFFDFEDLVGGVGAEPPPSPDTLLFFVADAR